MQNPDKSLSLDALIADARQNGERIELRIRRTRRATYRPQSWADARKARSTTTYSDEPCDVTPLSARELRRRLHADNNYSITPREFCERLRAQGETIETFDRFHCE